MQQALGARVPAGEAGTYKAAEHGAGDAGGQAHGRGRSGPAHMSPEPLRCPPIPGARRIPAAGLARCSRGGQEASALAVGPPRDSRAPPLLSTMERAQLRPPARAPEGGVPGECPGQREEARGGAVPGARPTAPGPSLPAAPQLRGRACSGDV